MIVVADLAPRRSSPMLHQAELCNSLRIENAANVQVKVLRHIKITDQFVFELKLPHSRKIANDIAGTGKKHAVERIEPPGYRKFNGRSGNAANVTLIISITVNDIELITTAENPDR